MLDATSDTHSPFTPHRTEKPPGHGDPRDDERHEDRDHGNAGASGSAERPPEYHRQVQEEQRRHEEEQERRTESYNLRMSVEHTDDRFGEEKEHRAHNDQEHCEEPD